MTWAPIAAVVLAYLLGSIPFGVLFARRLGIDLQAEGSGNIGATNAARILGKRVGAVVLLCDVAKGAMAVGVARLWLAPLTPAPDVALALPVIAGLFAVVGHCFPVWLRFNGGKGVATALGAFLVIDPVACGVVFAVFAVTYAIARTASVGSMVGALIFPVVLWWRGDNRIAVVGAALIAVLIVVRHRDNIRRLRDGNELSV